MRWLVEHEICPCWGGHETKPFDHIAHGLQQQVLTSCGWPFSSSDESPRSSHAPFPSESLPSSRWTNQQKFTVRTGKRKSTY
jgi:hypothetical protein